MQRIVGREVQSAALFALQGPTGDEIAHINHVAQLTDVARGLHALKEAFGLFIQHIQTVPGTVQAQIAAYDADIVGHDLVDLAHRLRDKHLLLVGHGTLVVPFGHMVVPVVQVDMLQRVLGSCIGIDHRFDQ